MQYDIGHGVGRATGRIKIRTSIWKKVDSYIGKMFFWDFLENAT